jgi:hypothetical protein
MCKSGLNDFQVSCLRFLNRFVETAKDARERIMIQTELEEAGFELLALKKRLLLANNTNSGGSSPEDVRLEQLLQVIFLFFKIQRCSFCKPVQQLF